MYNEDEKPITKDFKIGEETYGLVLTLSNDYSYIERDFDKLKNKIEKYGGAKIIWVNSLFGIQDSVILLRATGDMDKAVHVFDEWVVTNYKNAKTPAIPLPFKHLSYTAEKDMLEDVFNAIESPKSVAKFGQKDPKLGYVNIMGEWGRMTKRYLFSLNELSGENKNQFLKFIEKELDIPVAKNPKIIKSDNKEIIIRDDKNWINLKLDINTDEKKINITVSGGKTYEYVLEKESGKLNIYTKGEIRKKFEVFEYWVDPLIPIFVNEPILKENNSPFVIIYLRFDKRKGYSLKDTYSAFNTHENLKSIQKNIVAVFHGFGAFDIVIIAKGKNYQEIESIITKTRSGWTFGNENILLNSSSLITFPQNSKGQIDDEECFCFSTMLKISTISEREGIWKNIENFGKSIGLENVHIEKDKNLHENPLIRLGQGIIDIHIYYKAKISKMKEFVDVINTFPFVEDTSTVILYDIECLSQKFNS